MRVLAALFTIALLLSACGDDDDGLARTVTTTSTTMIAPASDSDASSTTTSSSDGDDPAAGTDAESIVLTIDDMPSGWSVAPPEDNNSDGESEDCFTDAAGEFEDNPDADIQFQKGSFLPFVGAAVTTYDDDSAAGNALDTLVTGFNACDGFIQTEDDGTETTWSVQPLSFPNLGDDTFATRMRADSDFGPFVIDIVFTRVNDTLIFVSHGALGDVDTQLTEQLQRTMVDRA